MSPMEAVRKIQDFLWRVLCLRRCIQFSLHMYVHALRQHHSWWTVCTVTFSWHHFKSSLWSTIQSALISPFVGKIFASSACQVYQRFFFFLLNSSLWRKDGSSSDSEDVVSKTKTMNEERLKKLSELQSVNFFSPISALWVNPFTLQSHFMQC